MRQGKQNLIFLQVKYSQNILPRWNVGIDYQRITSAGFLHVSTPAIIITSSTIHTKAKTNGILYWPILHQSGIGGRKRRNQRRLGIR
jgi:hypothetical protein